MIHIPKIHDRGRGPEIEGTRITVYDVMDYYCEGWPATRIAVHLGLGTHGESLVPVSELGETLRAFWSLVFRVWRGGFRCCRCGRGRFA